MSATDDRVRRQADQPVINSDTLVVLIPANAVAGTAEDLDAALRALGVSTSKLKGVLLVNDGGASVWLRSAAAGAGVGTLIANGGSTYFGWADPGAEVIYYEASAAFDAMCFFE